MAMRDDDVVDIRKARRNVSITLMCWVELSAVINIQLVHMKKR